MKIISKILDVLLDVFTIPAGILMGGYAAFILTNYIWNLLYP